MDIFDSIRVVLRWWFVTIPILMLSLGSAALLTSEIQPEYVAEGSVLVVGPAVQESRTEPGEFEPLNPLIDQPSALESVATVVALSIGGPQVASILAEEGLSTDFVLGTQRGVPIILLETRAGSQAVALATAERLAELVDELVQVRQADSDVPLNQRVTTSIIQLGAVGGADYGGRSRMRIIIVALGVGLAFGTAFLLDGVRRRRMSRRQDSNSDDGTDAPTLDAVPDHGPRNHEADPFTSAPAVRSDQTPCEAESNAGRTPEAVGRLDEEASIRGTRTQRRR